MHKEELIALHRIMAEIKDDFEQRNPACSFSDYYAQNVDPSQVHKSKMEHKHAIFVLGYEIAAAMQDVEYSSSSRIAARMKELAQKTETEIENNPEKYSS